MTKPSLLKMACITFVFSAATAIVSTAQTFADLVDFAGEHRGRAPEGANPGTGSLVQGIDGNLYGTTTGGGSGFHKWAPGELINVEGGTVFKITPEGELTTLYGFCSQNHCEDGERPYAGLIQASDGNFYGTTYYGGANSNALCGSVAQGFRCGTVFKITPEGQLTTLYSFCSQADCADGANPNLGLIQAATGDFYGTTRFGGATGLYGTIFRITPEGRLITLYSFCSQPNCADGVVPLGGLIQANDGNLYGTTSGGGANQRGGTVYQITPTGKLTTLYSFCAKESCTDGGSPWAGLIQATDGNFYGTTAGGGAPGKKGGSGTVFRITPEGKLRTLYRFCARTQTRPCPDGETPKAGLVQGTDGNLYGTTAGGTMGSLGTVFQITTDGALTTLHTFDYAEGAFPMAALFQATNGTFYGTTTAGAYSTRIQCLGGCGTVFSISVGLGPFVETQTSYGKVGATIVILGTDLTGTTSVTFNGTAATFTVISASEITATVPIGATTGTVEVTTPSGTLSSNVPFRVTP